MVKLFKKIVAMSLVCFTVINLQSVSAASMPMDQPISIDNISMDQSLDEISNEFNNMSVEELNIFITQVRDSITGTSADTDSISSSDQSGVYLVDPNAGAKLAWLAAAAIARSNGYPCAATLVEHSVKNNSYSETSGNFSTKIKTTSAYKAWTKTLAPGIEFIKSDNADLFYALHNVDMSISGSSSGATVYVTDTYDFNLDLDMGSLFSTLVNDWAWLCTQTGALSEISISIKFYL